MIPSQNEFINAVVGAAKKGAQAEAASDIRIASVVGVNGGKAVIQFAEDGQPSQKQHKALKHYIPVTGDRVILIKGIIIGGWQP